MKRRVKGQAAIVQQYDKKGVSAVVATVLIILIVVAAVAILWTFIIPLIRESTSFDATDVDLTVDKVNGYTYWISPSQIACVQVKRGNDDSNLGGIKTVFSVGGNSLTGYFEKSRIPGPNEEKQDCFNLSGMGVPDKVSIAPIIGTKEGIAISTAIGIPDAILGVAAPISIGGVSSSSKTTNGTVGRVEGHGAGGSSGDDSGPCNAMTCAGLGKQCGIFNNNCEMIDCGNCTAPQTCNAGQCVGACTPSKTCAADYPGQCGSSLSNGCTNSLNCSGSCIGGQTCNSTAWCACAPSCTGKVCGANGCGGSCGTCTGSLVCDPPSGQCVIASSSIIQIDSCGTLDQAGKTYVLNKSLYNIVGSCFTIIQNNITFDGNGFIIDGDDTGTGDAGVNAAGRTNVTIKNFLNITDFDNGINLASAKKSFINNVNLTSNYNGIYLSSSHNNTLTSNTEKSNSYGIYSISSTGNRVISNNASASNTYGIYLTTNSNNNNLTSNTVNSNSYGIWITSSNNNTLTSNTAKSNTYGIYLDSSHNNTLTLNTFNSNSYGIMLYLSNNNTFTSNTVNSNLGNGIYLSSSMNNTMSSNTLTLNSGSAIYLASSHNNYLIENLLYQNPSNKDIELSYSNSNSGANNCAYFIPGTGTGNTVTCG